MRLRADNTAEALRDLILKAPRKGKRRLVALAGPPASGKSTLAMELATQLSCSGCRSQVVPMDGFHLDNGILSARDLLGRKGAPETFDISGFARLIAAIPNDETIYFPLFDRDRDIAIAGAGQVDLSCDTVIVEGNYLLHNAPGWRELADCWDLSIALDVPKDVLRKRLVDRWLSHGLPMAQAIARAEGNDLPNATAIAESILTADVVVPYEN